MFHISGFIILPQLLQINAIATVYNTYVETFDEAFKVYLK